MSRSGALCGHFHGGVLCCFVGRGRVSLWETWFSFFLGCAFSFDSSAVFNDGTLWMADARITRTLTPVPGPRGLKRSWAREQSWRLSWRCRGGGEKRESQRLRRTVVRTRGRRKARGGFAVVAFIRNARSARGFATWFTADRYNVTTRRHVLYPLNRASLIVRCKAVTHFTWYSRPIFHTSSSSSAKIMRGRRDWSSIFLEIFICNLLATAHPTLPTGNSLTHRLLVTRPSLSRYAFHLLAQQNKRNKQISRSHGPRLEQQTTVSFRGAAPRLPGPKSKLLLRHSVLSTVYPDYLPIQHISIDENSWNVIPAPYPRVFVLPKHCCFPACVPTFKCVYRRRGISRPRAERNTGRETNIYIYIYMCVYVCICVCVYIFIYPSFEEKIFPFVSLVAVVRSELKNTRRHDDGPTSLSATATTTTTKTTPATMGTLGGSCTAPASSTSRPHQRHSPPDYTALSYPLATQW